MRRRMWGFTKHAACVVSMFALLAGFSANAQDVTLFVRGTMNEWGTANQMTAANNIYTTVLAMEAGEHEFKIANADWSVNFGLNSEPSVALDAAKTLAAGEGNLKVTLPEKGAYKVAFDFSNQAQPSLTVKAAQAVVIHYHRKNDDYEGWGLHLWNAATPSMPESVLAGIAWDKPRADNRLTTKTYHNWQSVKKSRGRSAPLKIQKDMEIKPWYPLLMALRQRPQGSCYTWIAEQIAHHAHASGMRQFNENRKIRSMLTQSLV